MQFEEVLRQRLANIQLVLGSKAKEYAKEGNRYHNFDVASRIEGNEPEQALWGMLLKHIVSVKDLVNAPETATKYLVNEKIGDFINYLILLEGLLNRRIEDNNGTTNTKI